MKSETYINRYNDEYKFTPDQDGNLLWEGDFKWCRYGMPNDYTKAYRQYVDDGTPFGFMEMEEFKEKLHEHFHEEGHPMRKYVMLVESRTDKIDMVDPSGGPYISVGTNAGWFHKEMEGKKVVDFEQIETGYKLILDDY
jgi:hypothetical protein